MFNVIIAGSRTFDEKLHPHVEGKIDDILSASKEICIISGTARGADQFGERYAAKHNYPVRKYPADWAKLGKRAGFVRNEIMAGVADAAILIWDGKSKGTKMMYDLMLGANKKVRVIMIDG